MHVGPKSKASVSFDKWCVYGNKIALKHTQVLFMRELAKKKPTLPVYVCTMQLANTKEPKAKMVNKLFALCPCIADC